MLVEVDGAWCPGELRQWSQDRAGGWWTNVTWRLEVGQTFLDTFPAERIKPDEG